MTDKEGPLRRRILQELEAAGLRWLSDLTVMSDGRDPYRLETGNQTAHDDAEWLKELHDDAVEAGGTGHVRGLHYTASSWGRAKPSGLVYVNDVSDWGWLKDGPAKDGRWLGEVAFTAFTDEKNVPAQRWAPETGWETLVDNGVLWVPQWAAPTPLLDFDPLSGQPFRVVLWCEKVFAAPALQALAEEFGLTLYVGRGDASDTITHEIAAEAAAADVPTVLVTFCDFDPAGWRMVTAATRKFQAFRDLVPSMEGLDIRVVRAGLTIGQVRRYGLPSAPLKATVRNNADGRAWRAAWGHEQTELDTFGIAPRAGAPDLPAAFREIARQAVEGVLDSTLPRRNEAAVAVWQTEAEAALAAHVARVGSMEELLRRRDALREAAEALATDWEAALDGVELPVFTPPAPVTPDVDAVAVVPSGLSWREETEAMQADRAYQPRVPEAEAEAEAV